MRLMQFQLKPLKMFCRYTKAYLKKLEYLIQCWHRKYKQNNKVGGKPCLILRLIVKLRLSRACGIGGGIET